CKVRRFDRCRRQARNVARRGNYNCPGGERRRNHFISRSMHACRDGGIMRIKWISLLTLATMVSLFVAHPVAQAADSTPAIDAFNTAFASIKDYTFKLRSHETKGDQVQDRVYDYWFLKPAYAKTLIESGDGRGSGGVWTGGDQVSGH